MKIRGYHVRTQCKKHGAGGNRSAGRHSAFRRRPHRADEVVARALAGTNKCRQQGSPVIMVRVGWSADFAEAETTCRRSGRGAYAARKLVDLPATLGKQESDIEVTKRQWGAFYGTDLELCCAAAGSTPSFSAASPPTSASNPPPTHGSWVLTRSSLKMPAAPPPPNSIRAA